VCETSMGQRKLQRRVLPWMNALIITDLTGNNQRTSYVNAKVEL